MKYGVVYLDRVQDDLQDAYYYYENELTGLGEEFLKQVETTIAYISIYPLHFQEIIDETRKSNLVKFPYAVFYYIHGDTIKITAVLHLHSDPENWP